VVKRLATGHRLQSDTRNSHHPTSLLSVQAFTTLSFLRILRHTFRSGFSNLPHVLATHSFQAPWFRNPNNSHTMKKSIKFPVTHFPPV